MGSGRETRRGRAGYRRLRCFIFLFVWGVGLPAAQAQQAEPHNDWLAALPTCAQGNAVVETGPTHLLYPRPGLPALVEAGAAVVARVRLPTPLTPPPGHQQEKALRGWSVSLRGHAHRIDGAEFRYALRVADVRPDAHHGLVYRVRIPVPAWVAPGTYDLRVQGPWAGVDVAVASVRVRSPGSPLRVGRLGAPIGGAHDAELATRLAAMPIDVWLVQGEGVDAHWRQPLRSEGGGTDGAVPWLDLRVAGALLRFDETGWRLGGCDDTFSSFDERVAQVEGTFPGALTPPPSVPSAGAFQVGEDEPRRLSDLAAVDVSSEGQGLHWVRDEPTELWVAFPEGMAAHFEGASDLDFWPATPPTRAGHRASVVARVRFAEDLSFAPAERSPFALRAAEATPMAGHPQSLRVMTAGATGPLAFAWAWEEDGAAYLQGDSDSELSLQFGEVGTQTLQVWAADQRGQVSRLAFNVIVETDRPRIGCSVRPGAGGGRADGVLFGLLALAWYGSRRRCRFRE